MYKQVKLINFRESLGLSKSTMARRIKVSYSFYDKIESGERNPSYSFIKKVKRAFPDANAGEIFFDEQLHEKCNLRAAINIEREEESK